MTAVVRAALAAVDAGSLVRDALKNPEFVRTLESAAAVDVVAVGKAASVMLPAPLSVLPHIPFRHVIGISNHAAGQRPPRVHWHVAAHPVPDASSMAAADAVMTLAGAAGQGDVLLLLMSGGASAMMAFPAKGISLADKRRASEVLLQNGAEVRALNCVRKHLSAIKGGQLAIAWPGAVLTLAVSDVVGDEPSAIGSGPTVADVTTFADALDVLDRHGGGGQYPATVVERLRDGARGALPETPKPGDPRLARSAAHVIGSAQTAINAARTAATSLGYAVHVVGEPVVGDARTAGATLVEAISRTIRPRAGSSSDTQQEEPSAARTLTFPGTPLCVLASGETTVRVVGNGLGGRNQECALGMLRHLSALGDRALGASIGTDGIDGPTDAAGALVDTTTLSRALAAGLAAPERYLDNNDSYRFFGPLGDLIHTGPTRTNVGDLQVILIG